MLFESRNLNYFPRKTLIIITIRQEWKARNYTIFHGKHFTSNNTCRMFGSGSNSSFQGKRFIHSYSGKVWFESRRLHSLRGKVTLTRSESPLWDPIQTRFEKCEEFWDLNIYNTRRFWKLATIPVSREIYFTDNCRISSLSYFWKRRLC